MNLGKGFCWPIQATPSQEHALPYQSGVSGGPALLCVCVGYPPLVQGDVSFPEFQVYNSLMLITTTQREDKNPGAILTVKSSSDMASLVLVSVHCQPPMDSTLNMVPPSLDIPSGCPKHPFKYSSLYHMPHNTMG